MSWTTKLTAYSADPEQTRDFQFSFKADNLYCFFLFLILYLAFLKKSKN